ncbi:MAG: NADP-dependent oxidoreductase [Nocardioides sp.]
MRAIRLTSFEGPSALQVAEIEPPDAGPGMAVVELAAASIGPWDVLSSQGFFTAVGGSAVLPQTIGWDLAGTVSEIGDGVTGVAVGDRVLGFSAQPWMGVGSFAELVDIPAELLAPVPAGVDLVTAATLPVALLTADLTLRTAEVSAGDSILVLGAVGAVGGFLTQLARHNGVRVVASVNASDSEEARRLGAAHVVDYDTDVATAAKAAVGPVAAVIDLVGPKARDGALAALAETGRYVTTVPGDLPPLPDAASGHVIGLQPDSPRLATLVGLVADGTIVARRGASYDFSKVGDAFAAARRAGGNKITVTP